jgi:hypothetical protein
LQGLKARVLYQMPSTAIAWSVYEGFKHVINNYNTAAALTQHPYDTLASELRDRAGSGAAQHSSSSGLSGEGGGGPAEKGADKLWEAFTDIPRRQLHASESWRSSGSSSSSSLAFQDRTFASPIRTD